ncbi:MAG: hypothetical protein AB7S26_24215 [Sandaracinaceae bacterium]
MKTLRGVVVSFALAAALASCADPFDPNDPRLEGARLVLLSAGTETLRYGGETEIRVRYETSSGEAIDSAPIDFAIAGDGGGSRLAGLQTTTDQSGEASMFLTAGNADAMFDVDVTPPRGDGVTVAVAVSDTDAGSILVNMSYSGMRTLVRFDASVFDVANCAALDPGALPTAVRTAAPATSIDAMPAFPGIAVGSNYVVAVIANGTMGPAAFGCVDGVVVRAREETTVDIDLDDLLIGPDFTGTWDLDNRFDFGDALPPSVGGFLRILDELTDDYPETAPGSGVLAANRMERFADTDGDGINPEFGQDPGAFVTDLVMRQTCEWDCTASGAMMCEHQLGDLSALYVNDFTSWPGANNTLSVTGGCGGWEFIHEPVEDQINNAVEMYVPDFITQWANLAGDLSRAITNAHILSVLTINSAAAGGSEFDLPMTHELTQMIVDLRDPTSTPPGMMRTYTFALADAGFASLMTTETTTVDGTTLEIPAHSFTLNWGQLVLYIYREIFLREVYGVGSTGELLNMQIDCMSVGDWISMQIPVSASTAAGYCMTALNAAGSAIENAIGSALDEESTFTIQGMATGADIDESTMRVGRLENGMWTGSWGEMSMTSNLSGTFTGLRRP